MDMTEIEAEQVMHWPSLPSRQPPGWRFETEVDGERRCYTDLPTRHYSLSSGDLAKVILFCAQRRFEMSKELPLNPYDCPGEDQFRADAYTFDLDTETQTALVWSRLPGIGWVRLRLDANELRDMATRILSSFPPQEQRPQAH